MTPDWQFDQKHTKQQQEHTEALKAQMDAEWKQAVIYI